MYTIREFASTPSDYAQLSTLQRAVWPDRDATVAALQYSDQARDPHYLFARYVAEVDRQMVGVGECGELTMLHRPGKYFVQLNVHPIHERRGMGDLLYEHIWAQLAQRQPAPQILVSQTREDKPQAVRFLHKRGYSQVMRSPMASLRVGRFQPAPFAQVIPQVQASGIELLSGLDLAERDANWQQMLYALDWECTQDEPLPDTPSKPTFAQYAAYTFHHPGFLPGAWFAALDQGHYVGMTGANRNLQNPRQLDTIFTGILRSHRRRGIATALKLLAIQYAQQHGFAVIKTDNEEHNPMLKLNLALGFRPESALLFFQKDIKT